MKSNIKNSMMLSRFYFRETWKEIPFLITVACGIGLLVAFILFAKGSFEAAILPSTYEILNIVRRFQPAILVLMALYSGELFSRDRIIKISPLMDVLPYSNGMRVLAQINAMIWVLASLLGLLMMAGVFTQLILGFYQLNIGLYLLTLFTEVLFNGAFMIVLTFFIHTLINHKFMGHALAILLIIAQGYLIIWGLEHKLFHYAKLSLGPYSDLIGFQSNSLTAFFYYAVYWAGLALLLIQFSKVLTIRGIETRLKTRLRLATKRLKAPLALYTVLGVILFSVSGANIYVNTTIKNDFKTKKEFERYKYEYEKQFSKFKDIATPEIIAVSLEADLYPSQDTYDLSGTYSMVNSGDKPIREIHIQEDFDQKISTEFIEFDKAFTIKAAHPEFKYTVYELSEALAPGDSLSMSFTMHYTANGFSQPRRQYLFQNQSFFTEAHLPALGYAKNFELNGNPVRARFGLNPKQRLPEISDSSSYRMGLNAARNVWFEAILSTDPGYYATTSGQLINQWSDNGRAYFHYKSKEPIENQYAVITGNLEQQTDYLVQGRDSVILSLFYYPAHTQNLEHILRATRASFKSYQENFSPYQYDRLTIMEIPRLHDFAMSVPNTIAFSEAMGFMTKSEQGGLNVPFYITAHEVAHQWWGDQVRGAIVKGEAMIAETLSHYAAGIVTLEEFGEESMRHIIQYERGRYLKGRKREVQNEQPLYKAESQSYIHYGKGLISMMALRHYISEDSVNTALRRVIREFPASQGIYPSSLDVIGEFRNSTPDSLQYLVTDLFERIIFLENRVQNASSKALSAGNYELTIHLLTEKYEADSEGLLQPTPISDWIELAVYGMDVDGNEITIYRQMHKFDTTTSTLTLNLTTVPTRVVIDPASILMDRNLDDNEWRF